MINPDHQRVNELAEMIKESYLKTSIISMDSGETVIEPEEFENQNLDFQQLASRSKVPGWLFKERGENDMVAADYAKSIVNGEKGFIRDMISSKSEEKSLSEISLEELKTVIRSLSDVDFLFIPLEFLTEIRIRESNLNFVYDKGKYHKRLKLDGEEIPVINSHKNFELDKIYAVDSSGIRLVQKTAEDMVDLNIESNNPKFSELVSRDSPLQILARTSLDEKDKLDLVVRSVFGIQIEDGKVLEIDYPEIEED